MSVLGIRIKLLRERAGMNQIDLAKELNVSNTTLSQYENGKRVPSDEIKIKLALFFNVSVDYLLGQGDQKTQATRNGPPLSQEQQELLMKVSDLSTEDLKKALEYIELLLLKQKPPSRAMNNTDGDGFETVDSQSGEKRK